MGYNKSVRPATDLDLILGRHENSDSPQIKMDHKDVTKIIREAYLHGVETLRYEGLEIVFLKRESQYTEPEITSLRPDASNSSTRARKVTEKQLASLESDAESSLLQDTIAVRQQQIEELSILQPDKYEELLTLGELEDDVQAKDDSGAQ